MYCRDCARYDSESKRCLDSKVNPPNWETAVSVSQVLGLRSICVFNDYRERLVRCRAVDEPRKARPTDGDKPAEDYTSVGDHHHSKDDGDSPEISSSV